MFLDVSTSASCIAWNEEPAILFANFSQNRVLNDGPSVGTCRNNLNPKPQKNKETSKSQQP